ncbi:MAG: hypothetical protein J0I06_27240 [Planctomycetes bacterium]|nr:hypothetical protein [Planctomycetota bacterium]
MPVIRTSEALPPLFRNQLVEQLALELEADPAQHAGREPVVYESPIPPTDRFFAVVVWSAWEDIPWGQRTSLILDAYRRADTDHPERTPRAPLLATANGLTWDEADETGFFKYAVTSPVPADQTARNAMIASGGAVTPDGVRLRFLDRKSAQKAVEALRQALPGINWTESRVYRSDD